jgi:hypothetical protein
MKTLFTPIAAILASTPALAMIAALAASPAISLAQGAQSGGSTAPSPNTVYRCPNNEYTNDPVLAKAKKCEIVPPNISVMGDAFRPPPGASRSGAASGASAPASAPRVSNAEQKARDSDRRRILEDELRAAETKLAELKKEYNNGEPERRGDERNAVKYQERIAQLKADVTRAEADVNAIKREIGNLKD